MECSQEIKSLGIEKKIIPMKQDCCHEDLERFFIPVVAEYADNSLSERNLDVCLVIEFCRICKGVRVVEVLRSFKLNVPDESCHCAHELSTLPPVYINIGAEDNAEVIIGRCVICGIEQAYVEIQTKGKSEMDLEMEGLEIY